MSKMAKTQSFYSHGEESIRVEFHTIERYPGEFDCYLRVLTLEGNYNFILNSTDDEKLETLYQSLRRSLIRVSNFQSSKGGKSDES